ncbi:MAG: hypothetical protein L0Y58_25165 [Verrucomicrobia subdivision 3 bacterium]|nr:hypothetical protein [Limisphaerales bacterium]
MPTYREADATYGYFDYAELPPIAEALDGSFTWLKPLDVAIAQGMQPYWADARDRSALETNLEPTLEEAAEQGINIPEVFGRFMRSRDLQERIPSCTACYFDAPERIVEAPTPGAGKLVRFMDDQQWCLLWYLYVEPSGAHAVVVSDQALDVDDPERPLATAELYLCAPDFETFLYRFWLENCIWFVLTKRHRSLTPIEANYLRHYEQRKSTGS